MREGHAFGLDELEQHFGRVAARIDLLEPGQRRRIGKAPGVDMEHRRDRHVDVVAMKRPCSGAMPKAASSANVCSTSWRWLK